MKCHFSCVGVGWSVLFDNSLPFLLQPAWHSPSHSAVEDHQPSGAGVQQLCTAATGAGRLDSVGIGHRIQTQVTCYDLIAALGFSALINI